MVLHQCPFGECTFLDEDHPRHLACLNGRRLLLKSSEILLYTYTPFLWDPRCLLDVHGRISMFGSSEEIPFWELTS